MTDIFHEIEEDLRRERMRKLWDRFGSYLIALALLVVAGTAGWSGWKYWREQQAFKASAAFEAASELAAAGKYQDAEAAFQALAKDGPAGYAALAAFRSASVAAQVDKAKGVAAFDALAADATLPAALREVARVRAGLMLVDGGQIEEVRQRVGALAAGTGPMRNSAREALALAELKAGNAAAANKLATEITEDAEATGGERSRAELIRRLTASAVPPPAEPAAPAASPATQ